MRGLYEQNTKGIRKVWIHICDINGRLAKHIKYNPRIYNNLIPGVTYTVRFRNFVSDTIIVTQTDPEIKIMTITTNSGMVHRYLMYLDTIESIESTPRRSPARHQIELPS